MLMPLVPTIIRCCAHIVRLVCGQTDKPSTVTLQRMRRGLIQRAVLSAYYKMGMKGVGETYSSRIAQAAREVGLKTDQVKVAEGTAL